MYPVESADLVRAIEALMVEKMGHTMTAEVLAGELGRSLQDFCNDLQEEIAEVASVHS